MFVILFSGAKLVLALETVVPVTKQSAYMEKKAYLVPLHAAKCLLAAYTWAVPSAWYAGRHATMLIILTIVHLRDGFHHASKLSCV